MKLNQFQLKEISKYWFDLSKLTVGSLILKFFEPNAPKIAPNSVGVIFVGLTVALVFAIVGIIFSKGVKK